jgi:hypothetical protein
VTATEPQASGSAPVCPRCGSPASGERWCQSCGLNLRQHAALPTADAYAERRREVAEAAARETKLREDVRHAQEEAEHQRAVAEDARRRQREAEQPRHVPDAPASRRPRWLIILGIAVLVVAGGAVAVVLASGSGKSANSPPQPAGTPLGTAASSGAQANNSNASSVGIDATGSAEQFVRSWMIAAYTGDTGAVCEQLTSAAVASETEYNASWSCSSEVSEVVQKETRNNPDPVATLRKATFYPREAGSRAVVQISGPGIPVGDSSMVHLVKSGGRWLINCPGYCNGTSP